MTVSFETLFLLSNKMGIFFAKKKPPSRVTEQDKAILVRCFSHFPNLKHADFIHYLRRYKILFAAIKAN